MIGMIEPTSSPNVAIARTPVSGTGSETDYVPRSVASITERSGRAGGHRIDIHLALLFLLSAWTPYEGLGYPALAEPLRYGLYLVTASLYVARARPRDWRHIASRPIVYPLFAFIAFCIASSAWSENPALSLPRALLLALTAAVCAQAVVRRGAECVASTLALSLGTFVGLGILAAILLPGVGVEGSFELQGRWRGLSGQKNGFGYACAILALILMLLPLQRSTGWTLVGRRVGLLIVLLGVVMSGSRGAMLDLLCGGALVALAAVPTWRNRLLIVILLSASVPLLLSVGSLLPATGNMSVLEVEIDDNSRMQIWGFGLDALVGGREFIGFGFGGFWTEARQVQFWQDNGWVLPNFHNGYVSILVETGIIGAAVFYLTVVIVGAFALHNVVVTKSREMTLLSVVCVVSIVHNVFENTFSRSTDFGLVVFFCAAFAIWLSSVKQRMPSRAAAHKP